MRAIVLSTFVVLVMPTLAWAQTPLVPSEAANTEADELDHRGVDFLKAGRYADAEVVFRRALALKRSYDIVGNLGLAEAGLERWRDAAEHLAFALSTFPANGRAAHRDLIAEKLALARPHVGALLVQVDVRGADVLVDDKLVGTSPVAPELFVQPGAHVVEARLLGRKPARSDVTVGAGSSATVALKLPEASGEPHADAVPSRGPRVALAITSGVLAVIGLAAGAGLAAAANSKATSAATLRANLGGGSTACNGGTVGASCQSLASTLQSQTSLARGSEAGFILGTAFAAAAIGLGVWAGSAAPVQVGWTGTGIRLEGKW